MKSLEEIKRIRNLKIIIEGEDGFSAWYTDPQDLKVYSIIMSWGGGWEHFSINPYRRNQTPSWDLMCRMKELFFKDDEACVEYHPRKQDYVNNMPHCLHIWRPLEKELPVPPPIYVGTGRKS